MDSGEASNRLSHRMEQAGFKKENAVIQSAMATCLECIFRHLLKLKSIFVFGSFSDGWGSCLSRMDGSVEADSDIDITLILENYPVHISDRKIGVMECLFSGNNHRVVDYTDGHIVYNIDAFNPNLEISRAPMLAALDVIVARKCCKYPPIKILEAGYQSYMSCDILDNLKIETLLPRCHAVAASPPGQEGTCMRVSTTHLERIVMRNLTTIQGQFFVIIKYLVKKVINKRVSGLKTYVAKNLLFYMLDTTPEEEWISNNLVSLVRESLQLLATMIENSAGDDVCMTHFFLRDANVYLRKEHESKAKILETIKETLIELPELLVEFERGLDCSEQGNVVHFHCFWLYLYCVELASANSNQFLPEALDAVKNIYLSLRRDFIGVEHQIDTLIDQVNRLPDCIKVSRECLRAMLHVRAGRSLSPEDFEFSISRGIRIESSQVSSLTLVEARRQVLRVLQETQVLKLEFTDNWEVRSCALEVEVYSVAPLLHRLTSGTSFNIAGLLPLIQQSLPGLRFGSEADRVLRLIRVIIGLLKFKSYVEKLRD